MSVEVVAVVVTYNRRTLLIECLNALQKQDVIIKKIIVIDNASTDGTKDLLLEAGCLQNKKIEYKLLDKNIGGAGGFNIGVEAALDYNPAWVWLMDDDGKPSPECLKNLLEADGDIRAPLVVDSENISSSSFPYLADGIVTKKTEKLLQAKTIKPVHPFNGVLISTNVIFDIGLPDKRFFIWGDEIDYRQRWLAKGYIETVNTNAVFYHPADRQEMRRSNSRSLGIPMGTTSKLRKFCYYRNQVLIYKNSKGLFKCIGRVVFTLYDVVKNEPDKYLFFRAIMQGLLSIYGGEKKYL